MPILNSLPGVKISALSGGTNTYELQLAKNIDGPKMQQTLAKDNNIRIARPGADNRSYVTVNETLLSRDSKYVQDAFSGALKNAGKA